MIRNSFAAYSELTRVLPWALRALGYPFGVADRGSHIIATAAAFDPDVLDELAAGRQRISARATFEWLDEQHIVVRGEGLSLIEVGPVTMDLAASALGSDGVINIRCNDVSDLSLLPAVLLVGAEYGLSAVAIGTNGWSMLGWKNGAQMLINGKEQAVLHSLLASTPRILAALSTQLARDTGDVYLIVSRERIDIPDLAGDYLAADVQQGVQRAHRQGLVISGETLTAIYALEKRTWAPSSERSRSQAGFGQTSKGIAS